MVGIKRLKLLIGIIIPVFAFFLMSQNTFADWVQQSSTLVDSRSYSINNGSVITDNNFGTRIIPFNILTYIQGENRYLHEVVTYNSITDNSSDKFKALQVDITFRSANTQNPMDFGVTVTTNKGAQYGGCVLNEDGGNNYKQFRCQATLQENSIIQGVYVRIGTKNLPSTPICILNDYYSGNCQISYMSINLTTTADPAVALLERQIQQQNTMINQNNQIINLLDDEHEQNQQAYDNISNQSSDDINGSTNNKTTSLINVITGFIGAFSGINPTNCNLTLEFPNYAGGSRVVNICSGKEKAPRIVEIGSSLLLICVFVPLAFVLIHMIYNEIRSWTNG